MKKLIYLLLAVLAMGATSCGDEPVHSISDNVKKVDVPETPTPPETPPSQYAFISFTPQERVANEAVNGFTLNFLNAVNAYYYDTFEGVAKPGNYSVSPVSAAMCLALSANSVDDAATANIAKVLGYNDLTTLNSTVGKLMEFLPCEENGAIMSLANSVWVHNEHSVDGVYINLMNDLFKSDVTSVDMAAPETPSIINGWVSRKTNGRINDIVSDLNSQYVALMVNALYFAGEWDDKFDKSLTKEEVFNGTNGKPSVLMMHKKEIKAVEHTPNFDIVQLDFKGCTSMFFALPKEGVDITDPSFRLTPDDMPGFLEPTENHYGEFMNVDLSLPRFDTGSSSDLNKAMAALGINCDNTTLSKMGINEQVVLNIRQKTSTTVDEEGTVAAAATFNGWCSSNGQVIEYKDIVLNFNRPFMYYIMNTRTRSILMAGRICNL